MKKLLIVSGVLIAGIIAFIKTKDVMKSSRGERNNNPFNIRFTGDPWRGLTGKDEKGFCVFVDMEHGIRAGLINLYNAYFSLSLTIQQIVHKYAPASDNNDEAAYVRSLEKQTGLKGSEPVPRKKYLAFAKAIMRHETGVTITDETGLMNVAKRFNLINYI